MDQSDIVSPHDIPLHPLCELFPRLEKELFDALREDIREHGLLEPIVLRKNELLDGANRLRACIEADVTPIFEEYRGDDPARFVLSKNLHRRHLPPGQRAAIVAAAQDWSAAETSGRPKKKGAILHSLSASSELPDCSAKNDEGPLATLDDRISVSGVSRRTQQAADKLARASPSEIKKVAHGECTLPEAIQALAPTSKRKRVVDPDGSLVVETKDCCAVYVARISQLELENKALREMVDTARRESDGMVAKNQSLERVVDSKSREIDRIRAQSRLYPLTSEQLSAEAILQSPSSSADVG